jgi:hypothetical protein
LLGVTSDPRKGEKKPEDAMMVQELMELSHSQGRREHVVT